MLGGWWTDLLGGVMYGDGDDGDDDGGDDGDDVCGWEVNMSCVNVYVCFAMRIYAQC